MARRVKSSRRKMTRKSSNSKKKMKRRGLSSRAKKISEILSSTNYAASLKKKTKKATKKTKKAAKTKKGMTYRSFVKANFKKKQQEMPGSRAPEIIKAVAAEWRKFKTDGPAMASARGKVESWDESRDKPKKKKSKTKTDNRPAFRP
jgi:hypothetical protein